MLTPLALGVDSLTFDLPILSSQDPVRRNCQSFFPLPICRDTIGIMAIHGNTHKVYVDHDLSRLRFGAVTNKARANFRAYMERKPELGEYPPIHIF